MNLSSTRAFLFAIFQLYRHCALPEYYVPLFIPDEHSTFQLRIFQSYLWNISSKNFKRGSKFWCDSPNHSPDKIRATPSSPLTTTYLRYQVYQPISNSCRASS